ncbi:microtubule cross-linking factor 1 isoform X1 [Tachysurus ichikawai]
MESADGSSSDTKPQNQSVEKKRLNRAPSPARPFLKDGHSRAPKSTALTPKSPKFSKQQHQQHQTAASFTSHIRSARRAVTGAKDKPAPVKSAAKSSTTKKASKVTQAKPIGKAADTVPRLAKSGKVKLIPLSRAPQAHGSDSPVRVPTGRLAQTDSSSDLSDCPSEPLSDEQRLAQAGSSDAESGAGSGSSERGHLTADEPADPGALRASGGARLLGQKPDIIAAQPEASPAREKPKPEKHTASAQLKPEGGKEPAEEDLLREVEELRSENDYLKVITVSRNVHRLQST